MLRPVHVMTTVSMLWSASGMDSAEPSRLPIKRKIDTGADAYVEDAPLGSARHALAIRAKDLLRIDRSMSVGTTQSWYNPIAVLH